MCCLAPARPPGWRWSGHGNRTLRQSGAARSTRRTSRNTGPPGRPRSSPDPQPGRANAPPGPAAEHQAAGRPAPSTQRTAPPASHHPTSTRGTSPAPAETELSAPRFQGHPCDMTAETFVIVGASLAGGKAAETLREEGFTGRVVLIGEETEPPYERPPLSKGYLLGATSRGRRPSCTSPQWYAENDIEMARREPGGRTGPAPRKPVTLHPHRHRRLRQAAARHRIQGAHARRPGLRPGGRALPADARPVRRAARGRSAAPGTWW